MQIQGMIDFNHIYANIDSYVITLFRLRYLVRKHFAFVSLQIGFDLWFRRNLLEIG